MKEFKVGDKIIINCNSNDDYHNRTGIIKYIDSGMYNIEFDKRTGYNDVKECKYGYGATTMSSSILRLYNEKDYNLNKLSYIKMINKDN